MSAVIPTAHHPICPDTENTQEDGINSSGLILKAAHKNCGHIPKHARCAMPLASSRFTKPIHGIETKPLGRWSLSFFHGEISILGAVGRKTMALQLQLNHGAAACDRPVASRETERGSLTDLIKTCKPAT